MKKDINNKTPLNIHKDDVFGAHHLGRVDRFTNDGLKSVFHSGVTGLAPTNKELVGPVFFTRPQLNLSSDNIRPRPNLFPLLISDENSMERYVRCMLDPRLMEPTTSIELDRPALRCDLIDNKCAFIPPLSNNLLTISGWPDKIVPTYSGAPGALKDVYSQVDGAIEIFDERDISVSFSNTRGNPVFKIIDTWVEAMCESYMGRIMPYPDLLADNELDYQCRIYVTLLKQDGITLSRMACTGVSIPTMSPVGTFFNRLGPDPYASSPTQSSYNFKSLGVIYNTNVIIRDFNDLVSIFNRDMDTRWRDERMTKIPVLLYKYFKGLGSYPRMNTKTLKMEWWIDNKRFDIILDRAAAIASQYSANPTDQ